MATQTFEQFCKKVDSQAARASKELGIPKQVILVQLANESANGTSSMAVNHNNYGGIKFSQYSKTAKRRMDGSAFAHYNSISDFFTDYIRVMSLDYYKAVREAGKTPGLEDDIKALGASPYDAGHYTSAGKAPGSKLAAMLKLPIPASSTTPEKKTESCPTCHRPL